MVIWKYTIVMLATLSEAFEAGPGLMHNVHIKDARTDWKRLGDKLVSACRIANAFDDSTDALHVYHPDEYMRRKVHYLTILHPILSSLRRYGFK